MAYLLITIDGIISLVVGLLAGLSAVYVFNHIPAAWLCDYGETPQERERITGTTGSLTDPYIKRIKENPWRWVYSAGFACLCMSLLVAGQAHGGMMQTHAGILQAHTGMTREHSGVTASQLTDFFADQSGDGVIFTVQLAFCGMVACWVLLLIALADMKYMIIPDQFVVFLAMTGVAFLPVHKEALFGNSVNGGKEALFRSSETGGAMLTRGFAGGVHAPYEMAREALAAAGVSEAGIVVIYSAGGAAIGVLLMALVAAIGKIVCGKGSLGFGDVKLYAALGFCIGVGGTVFVFLLSTLTAGVHGSICLASGRNGPRDAKPLGPHICAAAMVYIFVGAAVLL